MLIYIKYFLYRKVGQYFLIADRTKTSFSSSSHIHLSLLLLIFSSSRKLAKNSFKCFGFTAIVPILPEHNIKSGGKDITGGP